MTKSISELAIESVRRLAPDYEGDLSLSTPIGEGGAELDSIGCLELLLDIEAKTGRTLRDEHLTAECLASIGNLVAFMERTGNG